MSGTGSTQRKWWQWGKPHAAIATAVAVSLLVPTTGALPAAADDLVFALIEVSKTASPAAPDALIPGEQVTFDIEVSCSSTQTDCISMAVTDAMPAPLTLVSVSPSTRYTVVTTGNSFVATFTTPLDEGGVGLPAGELVTMQVIAAVPLDADASYNGQTVTNTAYVTVDNPESNVQDSADVLLEIPLDLQSTIVKTVTPTTVTSTTVTSMTVPEPCAGSATASETFAYDEIDGVDPDSVSLDVYRPTTGAQCPIVMWVHGGGFSGGNRSNMASLSVDYARLGYVTTRAAC